MFKGEAAGTGLGSVFLCSWAFCGPPAPPDPQSGQGAAKPDALLVFIGARGPGWSSAVCLRPGIAQCTRLLTQKEEPRTMERTGSR